MAESVVLNAGETSELTLTDEANGVVVVEHRYPAPPPKNVWAGSVDSEGSRSLGSEHENREISLVLETTSEAKLAEVQAVVALIGREGGTLTYTTPGGKSVTFDLLRWGAFDGQLDVGFSTADHCRVSVTFPALPYGRGSELVAYVETVNLVTNPRLEVGTTGWTQNSMDSLSREAASGTGGDVPDADWNLKVTGSADLDNAYAQVAVTSGKTYTASAWGRTHSESGSAKSWLRVFTDALALAGEVQIPSSGDWLRVSVTFTASSTATYFLTVQQSGAGTTDSRWTQFQVEEGSSASDYFDGALPGCFWSGTAHASTSSRIAFGDPGDVTAQDFAETTKPALVFEVGQVPGDVPALGRLVVDEDDAEDQAWVVWGLESRHLSPDASAALFFEAQELTALGATSEVTGASGAYSSKVMRNTALIADAWTSVMSFQIDATNDYFSHVGTFRVFARAYTPASNTSSVEVALEWSTGDQFRTSRNAAAEHSESKAGSWRLLDLGTVNVPTSSDGAQRWTGQLAARAEADGDEIDVDWIMLIPTERAGEGSGLASPPSPSYSARDAFDQTAGALNGKTADVGGTWATSGATTDFAVSGSGNVTRATTSDSSPRIAALGSTNFTSLAVGVSIGDVSGPASTGVVARYVDSSNYLAGWVEHSGGPVRPLLKIAITISGTQTVIDTSDPIVPGPQLVLRVATNGEAVLTTGGSSLTVSHAQLAPGGTLESGKPGLYDKGVSSSPTRTYDGFLVWDPVEDAALYASQSMQFRHDGVVREDEGGAIWSPVSKYEGDLLTIPPAGPENRASRLIVKASRGVPGTGIDTAADDISANLFVTPRWLMVPS